MANRERSFAHPHRCSRILEPASRGMIDVDKEVARCQLRVSHQIGGGVQWRARDSRRLKDIYDFILAARHAPGNPVRIEPLASRHGLDRWLELRIFDPVLANRGDKFLPPV